MRRRLRESFLENERETRPAFRRRWASTRYVQDMWELLVAGEEEHEWVRVARPLDRAIDRQPIHVRHHQVADHEVIGRCRELLERGPATVDGLHLEAAGRRMAATRSVTSDSSSTTRKRGTSGAYQPKQP